MDIKKIYRKTSHPRYISLVWIAVVFNILLLGAPTKPPQAQDTTKTQTLQRNPAKLYTRRWGKLSSNEREISGQPQAALALSGGGARGLAHIGVLRAFEEAGIEIVAIAGTSMGGIVGGLYCAGISPDEIEKLAQKIDFRLLFSNSPRRQALFLTQRENTDKALFSLRFDKGKPSIPTGLSSAQRLTEMLSLLTLRQNYAAGADFTKLSIPFTTVATDISTGEAVALKRGNLADAIRATMAFPLAISAVEIDGRWLMDGGMVKPIPVELAKQLIGANVEAKLVAVNTTKHLLAKEAIKDPFDMATQVTSIMSLRELREELDQADYVITPKVGDGNGVSFSHVEDFVAAGYREAQSVTAKLVRERQRKLASANLVLKSFKVVGTPELDSELKELQGIQVSQERLDKIFRRRWQKGDLIRMEVKSNQATPTDSLLTRSLQLHITGIPQPELSQIELHIENNIGERQSELEIFVLSRITSFGKVQLDSIANWVSLRCRESGSDLCAVRECVYSPTTKTVSVHIDEALGHSLAISGNSRTRRSFIRDRIGGFADNVPFTLETARHAYRDIYGSGIFERVSITVLPTEKGADIEVVVQEKNTLQMQFGYRWDDDYHSEGFVNVLESNILGIGYEGNISARFADRRQRFSAGLRTDRIFRTHVAFNLVGYSEELDRRILASNGKKIGFRHELRYGASLRIGQQIARFGIVSAAAIVEHVESTAPGALLPQKYDLRKIQIRSLVEDFDRTYFTRRGRKHIFSLESAGKIFGGATEYTKWFSSIESYFPITKRLNFHPKFTAAVSRANLPAPEQFYIGGIGSFEGFRNDELSDSKILLMNFDVRYMVLPRTYIFARYNTGNTFGETEDLSFANLRNGWAAALGLDTPFGPVIFGYGRATGNRERVFFQAGLKF